MEARSIFANPAPVDLMQEIQECVVQGNVDKASVLFQQHPEKLQQEVTLFDPSGCRLENTTYFKHALWTLNEPMCKAMIDSAENSQDPKTLLGELSVQFQSWKNDGISYKHKDERYKVNHQEQFVSAAQHFDGPAAVVEKLWQDTNEKLESVLALGQYMEAKQSGLSHKKGI